MNTQKTKALIPTAEATESSISTIALCAEKKSVASSNFSATGDNLMNELKESTHDGKTLMVNIDESSPLDKTQKLCDSCIRAKDYPLTIPLAHQCGYRIFDDAGNLCWPCPCWLPFPEGTVLEALSGSLEVKVVGDTQYEEDGNKESQAWASHKRAQADNEALEDSDGMTDDHAETLRKAVAMARQEALEEKKLKLAMMSAERNAGFLKDFEYRRDALIIKTQIEYLGIPQPKLK